MPTGHTLPAPADRTVDRQALYDIITTEEHILLRPDRRRRRALYEEAVAEQLALRAAR